MRRVAVVGIGQSRFGELWEKSFRDIVIEAGVEALEDASISGEEIEAIYVGNMSGGRYLAQEHIGALIADYSGLAELGIPSVRVEAADASGGVAFREAYLAVASGLYDVAIAAGAEKVTDVGAELAIDIMSSSADREWEYFVGATLPALYALIARVHMKEFGTKEEDMALVSVKNHKNAVKNPKAQFRREISVDDVLRSPYIAEPIKILDSAPISDGAAVVILASEEIAKKLTDTPVYVSAVTQASDYLSLQSRKDLTSFKAVKMAAKKAYKLAKIEAKDVDVAEVHDSFTIAEIIAYEDLGFCEKGEGAKMIREGETEVGGRIPVNVSGGLKACGHATGATGVRQIVDLVRILRDGIVDAETGLALNLGGTGATAVVSILRR